MCTLTTAGISSSTERLTAWARFFFMQNTMMNIVYVYCPKGFNVACKPLVPIWMHERRSTVARFFFSVVVKNGCG